MARRTSAWYAERSRLPGRALEDGLGLLPYAHHVLPREIAAGQGDAGLDIVRRPRHRGFEPVDSESAGGAWAAASPGRLPVDRPALAPFMRRAARARNKSRPIEAMVPVPQRKPRKARGLPRTPPGADPGGRACVARLGPSLRSLAQGPCRFQLEGVALARELFGGALFRGVAPARCSWRRSASRLASRSRALETADRVRGVPRAVHTPRDDRSAHETRGQSHRAGTQSTSSISSRSLPSSERRGRRVGRAWGRPPGQP